MKSFALPALVFAAGVLLVTQTGCLGLMSNFMHAVGADKIPAEYADLRDAKVAVVVLTDKSQFSDDVSARLLTRKVSDRLQANVKNVTLVREDTIQQWRDRNGWDAVKFADIGRGVDAEKVVGIEVTGMTLHEGATLYRGRADVRLTVTDVATGEQVFAKDIDEFTFPQTAGQYTSETTEGRFRKLFLDMLADHVGRVFYPYDFSETVALDGAIASQ